MGETGGMGSEVSLVHLRINILDRDMRSLEQRGNDG